eukprot:Gb_06620 [translate_table: standard]
MRAKLILPCYREKDVIHFASRYRSMEALEG